MQKRIGKKNLGTWRRREKNRFWLFTKNVQGPGLWNSIPLAIHRCGPPRSRPIRQRRTPKKTSRVTNTTFVYKSLVHPVLGSERHQPAWHAGKVYTKTYREKNPGTWHRREKKNRFWFFTKNVQVPGLWNCIPLATHRREPPDHARSANSKTRSCKNC